MNKKSVPGFSIIKEKFDGFMYKSKSRGLTVIQSESIEIDGHKWLHTSYSRKSRTPTYEDTKFIKDNFIGKDKKAIMIFPAESEHINIHPYCLHLWVCLNGDVLPDFTHGMGTI